MVKYKDAYECPYCHNTYDKDYKARDCSIECRDTEYPIRIDAWYCEMCGAHFEKEGLAESCEELHKEHNDIKYNEYLVKKNFESLYNASKHPEQKKLMEGL